MLYKWNDIYTWYAHNVSTFQPLVKVHWCIIVFGYNWILSNFKLMSVAKANEWSSVTRIKYTQTSTIVSWFCTPVDNDNGDGGDADEADADDVFVDKNMLKMSEMDMHALDVYPTRIWSAWRANGEIIPSFADMFVNVECFVVLRLKHPFLSFSVAEPWPLVTAIFVAVISWPSIHTLWRMSSCGRQIVSMATQTEDVPPVAVIVDVSIVESSIQCASCTYI